MYIINLSAPFFLMGYLWLRVTYVERRVFGFDGAIDSDTIIVMGWDSNAKPFTTPK